jgi:carboxylesterase
LKNSQRGKELERKFIPGAEPLFLEGSDIGCLLLHGGGGGTTWDLKEFANALHERTGMTIWLPALTGYRTRPEDLVSVTFDDLFIDVTIGLDKLLQTCNRVYVIGHSMGGVLALVLASEREEVDGVVTWATPMAVKNRMLPLLPTLNKIPLVRRMIPETYQPSIPQWLKDQDWIGYDWLPISIGFIMLKGFERLKKGLMNVTCPVLILQGSEDTDVTEDSAMRLFDSISSNRKGFHIIEGAGHPMMNQNKYKEDLFLRTIQFLNEL